MARGDGRGTENKQREGKFTLPLVTHPRTTSHKHRYEQADYPSLRSRAPPLSRYPSTECTAIVTSLSSHTFSSLSLCLL